MAHDGGVGCRKTARTGLSLHDDAGADDAGWPDVFVTLAGREPATRSRPPSHVLGDGGGGVIANGLRARDRALYYGACASAMRVWRCCRAFARYSALDCESFQKYLLLKEDNDGAGSMVCSFCGPPCGRRS